MIATGDTRYAASGANRRHRMVHFALLNAPYACYWRCAPREHQKLHAETMKIFFGQFYLDSEANYPFNWLWQRFVTERVSALVENPESFLKKYGQEYRLGFNVSARRNIKTVQVRGPTKFKDSKTVEYTLFLPHSGGPVTSPILLSAAMEHMLKSAVEVLDNLGFATDKLVDAIPSIIGEALSRPEFLESASN